MSWTRSVRLLGIVGLIMVLYFVVPVDRHTDGGPVLRGVLAAVVVVVLIGAVLQQLRLAALDGDRRVDGLVAVIAGVLVFFALTFYILETHNPGEVAELHTRLDALYFVSSTVMTIGYGDVHAVGQAARAIVLVQMLFDIAFVATAATLLTSRVRRAAAARAAERSEGVSPGSSRPRGASPRRHTRRQRR